jgi:hypothetical protein
VKIDSLYREDQFYFGFTYNTLQEKPSGLSQKKFSVGLSAGFLGTCLLMMTEPLQ